jgi:dihydropteroate synthase
MNHFSDFLSVNKPLVMGVLNVTPDSFSDGGLYQDPAHALQRIEEMLDEGADIIDVGGESTRPGSDAVPAEEERRRVEPVIRLAAQRFPEAYFSIDSMKAFVVRAALDAGAHIVNDVSGLQHDPEKADHVAEFDAGLIIMHAQGTPKVMQQNPHYDDIIAEISTFLNSQAGLAVERGVSRERIILDPGIGFGKTLKHNLMLFKHLDAITRLGYPVLMGASRKSMIGKLLDGRGVENDGRLAGTLALHYDALCKGAAIIRVHDVRQASDSIRIFGAVQNPELFG